MVDWDQVERLRSKGWDWDRIAGDSRVGYTADSGIEEPGRALKALYYQRRSKAQRKPSEGSKGAKIESPEARERRWTLERIGLLLVPIFGIWAILAWIYPSLVGLRISWTIIGILLAISAVILTIGLLRTTHRWNTAFRNTVIAGVVIGLVISGGLGVSATLRGCPNLTSVTTVQPGGSGSAQWLHAANPDWKSNGAPVFFFYGSVACPYCSASSWAIVTALQKFGSFSPVVYGHSDQTPGDFPNTPEIVLAGTTVVSPYVFWDVAEDTNDAVITAPTTSGCTEQAFLSTYNPTGSIPFVVIGGVYIHTGSFVSPAALQGLNATSVQNEISAQSGPAWDAVSPQMYWICAYLLKVNGGQPSSLLTQYPQIAANYKQIP